MLGEQVNGFIDYCKVSGFKHQSIICLSHIPIYALETVCISYREHLYRMDHVNLLLTLIWFPLRF